MPANAAKLTSIVEEYFSALRLAKSTGAATDELSTYLALGNLLNAVGATLKPKVFRLNQPANQVQKGKAKQGQVSSGGAIEVKGLGDFFEITAGWGHFGSGQAVMPGQGRVVERPYTADEREAMGDAISELGDTTFDVYLSGRAYWSNVPANVWSYKLGGYQVLKKWLSYRESKVLGRPLKPDEVGHFMETARRISGILGLVGQ